MKRYENRKNKSIVKVITTNEKENTITVEFITGSHIGEQSSYSLKSFAKSWKFLDEIEDDIKENKKSEKVINYDIENEKNIIEMTHALVKVGYTVKTYSNRKQNLIVKNGNKCVAEVCIKRKRVVIYSKDELNCSKCEKISNGKYKAFVNYSDCFVEEVLSIIF